MSYEAKKRCEFENGGELYEFRGPGLSYCGTCPNEILRGGQYQADAIVRMLAKAFEAGRLAAKAEIREVLGVHSTPWGPKIG